MVHTLIEEWKDIPGFEGIYSASTFGNIKSYPKSYKTGRGYIRNKPEEFIIGEGLSQKGYKRVNLSGKIYMVHRIVALTWIPNVDVNRNQINHIDCNKLNNYVNNLEWVTNQENRDHAIANDLVMRRDKNCSFQKLSSHDIDIIEDLYYNKQMPQREIAEQYGVGQQTISRVLLHRDSSFLRGIYGSKT